jgi:hypothetical protein
MTADAWLYVLGWFFISAFGLFLAYPAAWALWRVAGFSFTNGRLRDEARPLLLAALADAIICMMPISVTGLPPAYVAVGIVPATILMGYVYRRCHRDWSTFRPFVFVLVARFMMAVEMVAFMWTVTSVPY